MNYKPSLHKNYVLARIREDECIGCAKCIQACPVDAIIGAAKYTHTIIENECIGCKKCIPPCPVDCIDLITVNERLYQPEQVKSRFRLRKMRLEREEQEKLQQYLENSHVTQSDIHAAIARSKGKR